MTSLAGESLPTASGAGRSVWLTRRAVVAHVALAIWVPGCAVAAWWQVGIALGGDALGWVYSVMWPCFAVFGLVFWWFLVHDDPDALGARGLRLRQAADASSRPQTPGAHDRAAGDPDEERRMAEAEAADPELSEYNAYLAALADRDKTWRRR
jgi:hypothetical protein